MDTKQIPCPDPASPTLNDSRPFSPLGWSAWLRLGAAGLACGLLWMVVAWALD
jgi:hypothetical protein